MDELICRALHGRTSDAEGALLEAWRGASAENEAYYRDMVRLLEATVAQAASAAPAAPSVGRLLPPGEQMLRTGSSSRWLGWIGRHRVVAALVSAAAVVTWLVTGPGAPTGEPATAFSLGTGEIVTGAGETTTVKLGDGTIVRIAPSSRLRITGAPGTREVWLDGRAYFAVAPQEGRPFRVRTHVGDAVVLGTRFDLQARDEDLRLLVVDGAVSLAAQGATVDVVENQAVRATPSLPPVPEKVDAEYLATELSWLGNFLVFENTPLSRVAQELTQHYGVPVAVLDSALAAETVQGMFSEESLDDVARVICRALSAHCSIQPTRITISP